jgi:UDP-N-acetylmuramoylalanine--D-glutamate ligase
MKIADLNGKNVCVLGYGREGQAMVEAIQKYAPSSRITVADKNEECCPSAPLRMTGELQMQLGAEWLRGLDQFDVVIKSPGIPPKVLDGVYPESDRGARIDKKRMTTPTQIFFDTIKDSGATVIGVTGSKGKSTTASLIHHILQTSNPPSLMSFGGASQKPVTKNLLIGNIGEPAISHLKDAKKETIFVMEMSSYQLMDLITSPHIAVITSFFPEHLDYHGSVEAYQDSKKNITRHQTADDMVFFCASSYGASEIAKEGEGVKIPFTAEDALVTIEETNLIGVHNLSNIAGAYAVAMKLDVPTKQAIAAIKTFHGLPHRLQSLGLHHDIEWIDDAISTTPESAIAAIDALNDRVATIILGGQDRGNDFTALGTRIAKSSIKTVILFPGSGPRIKKAIEDAKAAVTFYEVKSMEEAVKLSTLHSPLSTQSIVLLSTASPSYGMFKNFEEKGDCFKKEILKTEVSH